MARLISETAALLDAGIEKYGTDYGYCSECAHRKKLLRPGPCALCVWTDRGSTDNWTPIVEKPRTIFRRLIDRMKRKKPEPYRCPHGHADELDCPVCGH